MKKDIIILTDNHRRSLSSTLIVIEQLLVDIKNFMLKPNSMCCTEFVKDINGQVIDHNQQVIEEALEKICLLREKYNTEKEEKSLQRIVNTKKTKIWETLHNSKAVRIKGFGEFPQKLVRIYDKDIDELMAITAKIKIK
jgi:hypothetical protein